MLVKGATGVIWQQAITWANVNPDICQHMASLGHKYVKNSTPHLSYSSINQCQSSQINLFCLTVPIHLIYILRLPLSTRVNHSPMGQVPWQSFINSSPSSGAYMRQWAGSPLVQIIACRLISAKPLSEPMLERYFWILRNKFQWNLNQNTKI